MAPHEGLGNLIKQEYATHKQTISLYAREVTGRHEESPLSG